MLVGTLHKYINTHITIYHEHEAKDLGRAKVSNATIFRNAVCETLFHTQAIC